MGLVDQSLDEIIKDRKTLKTKRKQPNATGMYSDNKGVRPNKMAFQKKRLQSARQQKRGKIVDARLLIKSKTTITDARQKLKPKKVVDARQKIQAKHNQGQNAPQKPLGGGIPKVTIPNELALRKQSPQIPNITLHITQGSKTRSTFNSPRKNRNSHTVNQRLGSGIKIAVENELATSRPRRKEPSWQARREPYENFKITAVNKDAIRRKPSPPPRRLSPSPPPLRAAPTRKRSMPSPESDDSYDERPIYSKQRRQQRSPVRIPREREETYRRSPSPLPRQHSKPDKSTLRPMISKQTSGSQSPMEIDDDIIPLGPSPIEGTKLRVFNLHPVVTEDDILELFSVLGAVRRARLVNPGEAEVVYIKHENAYSAYKKYNNRDLDGQPMQIELMSSDPPRQPIMYSWMKEIKSSRKKNELCEVTELHSGVLQQALFKGGSTGTSTRPVVFTVKI